jgi:hypothetical protein
MPFTKPQKAQFITLLQAKGWQLRDGTIYAPSGGLWFSDEHFDWSPPQMHEIFTRRAARLRANAARIASRPADNRISSLLRRLSLRRPRQPQDVDWVECVRENQEAAWAAQEAGRLQDVA